MADTISPEVPFGQKLPTGGFVVLKKYFAQAWID